MSEADRVWESEGVRFDTRHHLLPADTWRSNLFECTVQAGLLLPSIQAKRQKPVPGVWSSATALFAGDVVSVTKVSFTAGRRFAFADLTVKRGDTQIEGAVARFWRREAVSGPRGIVNRILTEECKAGDFTAIDHVDWEYAAETSAFALATGIDPRVLRVVEEAYAWLGYQAGRRYGEAHPDTPAVASQKANLDAGRSARRVVGDPDREIARRIIWERQNTKAGAGGLSRRECSRLVREELARAAAETPDDRNLAARAVRELTSIDQNIAELFVRHPRIPRQTCPVLLAEPPE